MQQWCSLYGKQPGSKNTFLYLLNISYIVHTRCIS
jgi:hypothetical protein